MAEFCTCCAERMGFPEPDIDIEAEALDIKNGYYKSGYICEGCGLVAIGKFDGKIKVAMIGHDDCGDIVWQDFDPDYTSEYFDNDPK